MATDGEVGIVTEFFFDDEHWTVRYLVVDVGPFLTRREVLIAPEALKTPEDKSFPVNLTKEQIRKSPEIDLDEPVLRQHEDVIRRYFNWPVYWHYGFGLGLPPPPPVEEALEPINEPPAEETEEQYEEVETVSHLRSTEEMLGYRIMTADGEEAGHIDDFLVEDMLWVLRHIVVDLRSLLPGKRVLISPEAVRDIDWETKTVTLSATREAVLNAPRLTRPRPSR